MISQLEDHSVQLQQRNTELNETLEKRNLTEIRITQLEEQSKSRSSIIVDLQKTLNTSLTKQEQSDQNVQRQLLEINSKLNQSLEKQNTVEIRTTQLVKLTNEQSSTIFDLEVRQNQSVAEQGQLKVKVQDMQNTIVSLHPGTGETFI